MGFYPPCEYCGIVRHQPYEDGLLECRQQIQEQRDEARDECVSLRAKLAACVRTLTAIQWNADASAAQSEEFGYCPDCGETLQTGHSEDCVIGFTLASAKAQ